MAILEQNPLHYPNLEYRSHGLSEHFQTILDAAQEAFVLLDSDMRIILGNRRFRQLLQTQGEKDFPGPGSADFFLEHSHLRERLSSPDTIQPFEINFIDASHERRIMMVHPHTISIGEGKEPLILLALRDLTPVIALKKRLQQEMDACDWAEKELQDSGKRYQILVESMNDGLAVRDEQGLLTYVNKGLCDMLGYSREELIGRPVYDLIDERNRPVFAERMRRREKGMHEHYELKFVRKNGREIEILLSPMPIYNSNGEIAGSFAVISDISERKRIETALRNSGKKLRILSNRLFMAQEEEREHISRELHDQLGQDLTVLKYQLRFIEKRLRKDQRQLREACLDSLQHIDDLVEKTRRISRQLSPYNLQHVGLTAALRRISEDFSKYNMIEVSMSVDNIDRILPLDAEISLYRIIQEALANVSRYARASKVVITVKNDDGIIRCSIEDNGIGFDVAKARAEVSETSDMGLITMEERAKMIGGVFQIHSREGLGTHILITVPVRVDEEETVH